MSTIKFRLGVSDRINSIARIHSNPVLVLWHSVRPGRAEDSKSLIFESALDSLDHSPNAAFRLPSLADCKSVPSATPHTVNESPDLSTTTKMKEVVEDLIASGWRQTNLPADYILIEKVN